MPEQLDIYEPESNAIDEQSRKNRDYDAASLQCVLRNLKAAYEETLPLGAGYWQRQGNKAVAQLQRFAAWKTAVLTIFGADVPEEHQWLVEAGSTLVPHQDGTVTVAN